MLSNLVANNSYGKFVLHFCLFIFGFTSFAAHCHQTGLRMRLILQYGSQMMQFIKRRGRLSCIARCWFQRECFRCSAQIESDELASEWFTCNWKLSNSSGSVYHQLYGQVLYCWWTVPLRSGWPPPLVGGCQRQRHWQWNWWLSAYKRYTARKHTQSTHYRRCILSYPRITMEAMLSDRGCCWWYGDPRHQGKGCQASGSGTVSF